MAFGPFVELSRPFLRIGYLEVGNRRVSGDVLLGDSREPLFNVSPSASACAFSASAFSSDSSMVRFIATPTPQDRAILWRCEWVDVDAELVLAYACLIKIDCSWVVLHPFQDHGTEIRKDARAEDHAC